jgi:hypothetical protein
MGIATFPAGSSGLSSAIKSIQRGVAASAGNITISSVDTTKTICNSFSTSSAGTVQATGTISATTGTVSATSTSGGGIAATNRSVYGAQSSNSHGGHAVVVTGGTRYAPTFGVNAAGSGTQAIAATNLAAQNINSASLNTNATNLSGGTTALTAAVYGIHLVNATTITATGPCRYEVVEYF